MLQKAAKRLGMTKNEVVKGSIRQYCEPILKEKKSLSDFIKERIKDLPGSGRGDLSIRHEELFRYMLLEKKRKGQL